MALQHLRSSTQDKRPQPASLSDGQLAVNTHNTSPGLFFKDSAGGLIKVGPVHVGTTAPNASPAVGGSTGNTIGEQWLDTTGGTYVFKVWDGTNWRSETGTFVDVNGDVMTGALGIIAGTAGAPGLYFSGDTNTGIYSPGADQVAISTNGTGRLSIDANGNVAVDTNTLYVNAVDNRVGVGTTSPGYALQVVAPGDNVANSAAARIGQTNYSANDGSGPHYGLYVRQLGARYHLNYGIYSEVAGDNGFFGGSTVDGYPDVRGIGVYGYSLCSAAAYQKSHGVYGKADNSGWNYNLVVGVRGLANAGTSSFTNSSSLLQAGYGGHFVSFGKANSIGVYADAYLDASPGAGQQALPLLVASNGAERLRVAASGTTTLTSAASTAPFIANISSSEVARIDSSGRLLVGTSSDSGGALLQVNGDRIRVGTAKTPASATATGTAGEICWDASYVYVCTATNTWKRSALSTW